MKNGFSGKTPILVFTLIIVILAGSVGYILIREPSTIDEEKATEIAMSSVEPPVNPDFHRVRQFNISGTECYVVSWKSDCSIIEVLVDKKGKILDTIDYRFQKEESNVNISRTLARMIAESLLQDETEYSPESQEIGEPEVYFGGGTGYWKFFWQRQVGNFTIFDADFLVMVDADTGEAETMINTLDDVPHLEAPGRIEISEEQVKEMAWSLFAEHLEEATLSKFTRVILGMKEHPEESSNYTAVWRVDVEGTGMENGQLVWKATAFLIDAFTGEKISDSTIGLPIIPTSEPVEYFGNDYPVVSCEFPSNQTESYIPVEEAYIDLIVKFAKGLEELPQDSVLEVITGKNQQDGTPVWAFYWARTFDGYRTGNVLTLRDYDPLSPYTPTTDGILVLVDAGDGSMISYRRIWEMPSPANMNINISKDQALQVIKTSDKVDPRAVIVKDEALVYAEPRVMLIDWSEQLSCTGDYERIYISPTSTNETRLYWKIVYSSNCISHGCYQGRYIVDAVTGELMLVLEDRPMLGPLPFKFTIEPEELIVRRGESAEATVNVYGKPNYHVPIPPSLEFEQVPIGLSVSIEPDSDAWTDNLTASFTFTVSAVNDAPTGKTHLAVKIRAIGFRTGKLIDIEIE